MRKAWVFVMVLGFCRHLFCKVVFNQKLNERVIKIAGDRICEITGKRPLAQFKEIEKAALKELPAKKYLLPCHRVIIKMGDFGNYGEGRSRKKALIGWEAAKRSNI